jgi:hypothetical protein
MGKKLSRSQALSGEPGFVQFQCGMIRKALEMDGAGDGSMTL